MAEKENIDPLFDPNPSKKRKVSLSLKGKRKEKRFGSVSEEALSSMAKTQMTKNTEKSSKWAMANFVEWFHEYNKRNEDATCPEEVITPSCSKDLLNKWLCVYISETRNKSGELYPPSTIQSLLSGILRYMRQENPSYPNFFSKDDPAFSTFQATLNNVFKSLRSGGIGAEASHTETITSEEEDTLWETGVLNIDSPKGLLRCVFYYNGKCFCLRGGQEHRELGVSQLKRLYNPDCYIYSERSSKNRPGGTAQIRLEHKTVPIVANHAAGICCHVFLLDMYLKKLPPIAIEKDYFYCKPSPVASEDKPQGHSQELKIGGSKIAAREARSENFDKMGRGCYNRGFVRTPRTPPGYGPEPWYYPVPVGKNTLGNMVKDMATEAGLSGKKTNHSLRVAGATSLYRAGVPERIIQERTGHRSLQSLRQYERTSVDQEMAVSRILSGEADRYNPKPEPISTCAVTEATCSTSIKIEENPSPKASKQPMVQYNNCTVNVFGGGKAQASPAPYPQYLPPPSSLMDQWINEGYQDFADYTY
uniref:DUF3504 domain-containing protein n=1 Tax=Amphimedon queenslandica TaxID=400682 RepID=A0A1X7TT57_AMPQE